MAPITWPISAIHTVVTQSDHSTYRLIPQNSSNKASGLWPPFKSLDPMWPPNAVLHFQVLILNLTVITNFITVSLCDCKMFWVII